MERWEYIHVTFKNDTPKGVAEQQDVWRASWKDGTTPRLLQGSFQDVLKTLGDDGWELAQFGIFATVDAIFKRRKP